jgi:succinyl-CoA synthetase beta subunit/citryl-CoA synthetase large subunit
VPPGFAASSPAEAAAAAAKLGAPVIVKALIAAGRRGKANAVRVAADGEEAAAVTAELLGRDIAGLRVDQVYVEQKVSIAREFYVSLAFGNVMPRIVLSRHGGVEIEETFARDPAAVIQQDIDLRHGLKVWEAMALWERAGVESAHLPKLAAVTVQLFDAFRSLDALMLEINPLTIDASGAPAVVGAMMELDNNAAFRHPDWAQASSDKGGRLSPREKMVIEADKKYPGGAVRYTELAGDIGLMVAGGGASLLQHDLIVAAGGAPANHSDISPTPTPDKPAAVFDAIFSNPNARSLLIGYNYLQMAPCDNVIAGLLIAMKKHDIDARKFPIVIRLFGPKEEDARRMADLPGILYLPRGASLADGVQAVIEATRRVRASEDRVAS